MSGRDLTDHEIHTVVKLLATTDMPIEFIAERMHLSRSTIININKNYHVRNYAGHRSCWTVHNPCTSNSSSTEAT